MNLSRSESRLLVALAVLTQENESIDIFTLSSRAELSLFAALRALASLHDLGLADRRRLRLTLPGLARAVAQSPALRAHAESARVSFVELAVA
jgi:hypothetical protein